MINCMKLFTCRLGQGRKNEKAFLQERGEPTSVGNLELAKHPLGILADRYIPRPE